MLLRPVMLHATRSLLLSMQAHHKTCQCNLARALLLTSRQMMQAMKRGLRPTAAWCLVNVMTRAAQGRALKSMQAVRACCPPALSSPPHPAAAQQQQQVVGDSSNLREQALTQPCSQPRSCPSPLSLLRCLLQLAARGPKDMLQLPAHK